MSHQTALSRVTGRTTKFSIADPDPVHFYPWIRDEFILDPG
jgi:hypothetical protein